MGHDWHRFPEQPGVYFFYDDHRLLYIGQSVNLRRRIRSYFRENGGHSARTARIRLEAQRIEFQHCGSALEAALSEAKLIKTHLPPYNIRGRRSRHFPFLKVVNERFPRVMISYQLVADGSRYLGPFRAEHSLRAVLEILRTLTPFRDCHPMPTRHCIEFGIGRCPAPCENRIDEDAYLQQLELMISFLNGTTRVHIDTLHQQMWEAAAAYAFERAAILRDRIGHLERWQNNRAMWGNAMLDDDWLVCLPSREPECKALYLIRRGRLRLAEYTANRKYLTDILLRVELELAKAPPDLLVNPDELDEVHIIAAWLYRHGQDPSIRQITPDNAKDCLTWALTIPPPNDQSNGCTALPAIDEARDVE